MGKNKVDFSSLKDSWPSDLVARTEIGTFTGGLISEKSMANRDSLHIGVPNRVRVGRKIAYRIDDLIAWLEARSQQLS